MSGKIDQLLNRIEKDAPIHGSIPFWSWNDRLCEDDLRRQIRDMHALGMRGFFMHARGGLETEYMSREWFDAVHVCVDEAKKHGMEAWAYDENGWPSGFAGGELLKDSRNHACGLICETSDSFPDATEDLLGYLRPCTLFAGGRKRDHAYPLLLQSQFALPASSHDGRAAICRA